MTLNKKDLTTEKIDDLHKRIRSWLVKCQVEVAEVWFRPQVYHEKINSIVKNFSKTLSTSNKSFYYALRYAEMEILTIGVEMSEDEILSIYVQFPLKNQEEKLDLEKIREKLSFDKKYNCEFIVSQEPFVKTEVKIEFLV